MMGRKITGWFIKAVCIAGTLCTPLAYGQASNAYAISGGPVMTPYNTPAANAPVRVCPITAPGTPCNTAGVALFSDYNLTRPIPNPTSTNSAGVYSFFASTPASYLIQVQATPTNLYTYYALVPSGGGGSTPNPPQYSVQLANSSVSALTSHPLVTVNTSTGNLQAPGINSMLNAYLYQTPNLTSNNGIATALSGCTAPCQVEAPPNYSMNESQPWGGAYWMAYITTSGYQTGPATGQPVGGVVDYRYGPPMWTLNSAESYIGNRIFASPAFAMNTTSWGAGLYPQSPSGLQVGNTAWMGGHNFTPSAPNGDKADFNTLTVTARKYTEVQDDGAIRLASWGFGNGDLVGQQDYTFSYGGPNANGDEANEGHRDFNIEGGAVPSATVSTISTAADGSATIGTTGGTNIYAVGEKRLLIDVTKDYNTGYIATYTPAYNSPFLPEMTGSSTANWDSFGLTTQTTLTTAIPQGTTNLFPESNVVVSIASTAGFTSGALACIWDYDYECEKVAAVGSGTITLATVRQPHVINAYVTTGGLTGYGFRTEADDVTPGNTLGVAVFAPDFNSTVSKVSPILMNTSGNHVWLFIGANAFPGVSVSAGFTTRTYTQMGSGGTVTLTVAGGAVTACTASGGTGYSSNQEAYGQLTNPPQVQISGSWTTAPSVYISGANGYGALTACTIASPGTGVTSATATVVPTNQYDIYPAAKTYQVYDAAAGQVDGTFYTEPFAGTIATGDTVSQPHYFQQNTRNTAAVVGTLLPYQINENAGTDVTVSGIFQGGDHYLQYWNVQSPSLYYGHPLSTPQIPGSGQLATPDGFRAWGPVVNDLNIDTPPFGEYQGYQGAAVINVGCGGISCALWTNGYNLFKGNNAFGTSTTNYQASDRIHYNPATSTMTFSMGSTGLDGAGSTGSLNIGPSGVSFSNGYIATGYYQNFAPWSNLFNGGSLASTWTNVQGLTLTAGQPDPTGGTSGVLVQATTPGQCPYGTGCLLRDTITWPAGTVNTTNSAVGACTANCVSWVSGTVFYQGLPSLIIAGTSYTITSWLSSTLVQVSTAPGTQTAAAFTYPLLPLQACLNGYTLGAPVLTLVGVVGSEGLPLTLGSSPQLQNCVNLTAPTSTPTQLYVGWSSPSGGSGEFSLVYLGVNLSFQFPLSGSSTEVAGIYPTQATPLSTLSYTTSPQFQFPITLTTTGTSGPATFSGNVLNVPNYAVAAGVTSINSTAGAFTFSFSAGAGNCTGTTCTFTGSGSGGGSVTNFIAGTWPSWLTPAVATSTTTPTLSVTASAIPNSALAYSSTSVNGTTCTLGSTCSPPAGTISTATLSAITGIIKGAAGNVAQAIAGTDYVVPSGNVATATALAATPTQCSSGQAANGIAASGNAQGCFTPGTGSVTTFSAGNLSPLFTTSVATATSTPALTFALSNAAQGSVFAGPASGGAGLPSFQTAPTISAANMTSFPTLNQNTTGTAANLSGTPALPNGTSATTQAAGDSSTDLATDAFVANYLPKVSCITASTFTFGPQIATCGGSTGSTFNSGLYNNENATVGTAITGTLPNPVQGMQYCIENFYNGTGFTTGAITITVTNTGTQKIIHSVNSSASTSVASGGAAGDAACFYAASTTQWDLIPRQGVWTP